MPALIAIAITTRIDARAPRDRHAHRREHEAGLRRSHRRHGAGEHEEHIRQRHRPRARAGQARIDQPVDRAVHLRDAEEVRDAGQQDHDADRKAADDLAAAACRPASRQPRTRRGTSGCRGGRCEGLRLRTPRRRSRSRGWAGATSRESTASTAELDRFSRRRVRENRAHSIHVTHARTDRRRGTTHRVTAPLPGRFGTVQENTAGHIEAEGRRRAAATHAVSSRRTASRSPRPT